MAFDEVNVEFKPDQMGMDAIGPDMAKVSTINIQQDFSKAWGINPQGPGMNMNGPDMQVAEVAPVDPKDPHNLWGNTPARDPLLERMDGVAHNVSNNTAMGDGAGYAMNAACDQLGELAGGVFDLLNPAANEQTMDINTPAMGMQMQMRPGMGGMFS